MQCFLGFVASWVLTVLAPAGSPEREGAAEPPTSSAECEGDSPPGQGRLLREGTTVPEAVGSYSLLSDAELLATLPRRGSKRVSGPDQRRGQ